MTREAPTTARPLGKAGERESFEALAMPLLNQLYYTALRLTRNRLDAEDLVQETFLKACRFYHQFTPGTNFGGWISRILITNFINRYRRKKREPRWVSLEAGNAVIPHEETHDAGRLSNAGVAENYQDLFDDTIATALDRVPEHYRMIVLLSDVSGLSYKEIAHAVGCPLGTVMSRLSRGRKLLGRMLNAYASAHRHVRNAPAGVARRQASMMVS